MADMSETSGVMIGAGEEGAPALWERAPRPKVAMTPSQMRTFNDLLAVGGARPTAPPRLAEDLHDKILAGTAAALESWTEARLWLSKGQLFTALRCEGQLVAEANAERPDGMTAPTAVGIVSHRAIQIAHTHPGRSIGDYVHYAVAGARGDASFDEFWSAANPGTQSDLLMQMVSKVAGFLDSWPQLDETWTPRFEEAMQAKVGALTLSCRADLVLGRPRADGRQTMFLADIKSGSLHDHHVDEGRFYALVATLRHGCPPFRSTVYSLASGEFSDPEVSAATMHATADLVIDGVVRLVAVLAGQREAELNPGQHCSWCPAKLTCPEAQGSTGGTGRRAKNSAPVTESATVSTSTNAPTNAPTHAPITSVGATPPRPPASAAGGAKAESGGGTADVDAPGDVGDPYELD